MNTPEYLDKVRAVTGFTNYKIAQEFAISQSEISKYKLGKVSLSEAHAFQFSEILGIPADKIIADTKLENALKKSDTKKIEFWTHQVERLTNTKSEKAQLKKIKQAGIEKLKAEFQEKMDALKHGLTSAVIFSVLAFSPVDELHATDISEPVSKTSSQFILC